MREEWKRLIFFSLLVCSVQCVNNNNNNNIASISNLPYELVTYTFPPISPTGPNVTTSESWLVPMASNKTLVPKASKSNTIGLDCALTWTVTSPSSSTSCFTLVWTLSSNSSSRPLRLLNKVACYQEHTQTEIYAVSPCQLQRLFQPSSSSSSSSSFSSSAPSDTQLSSLIVEVTIGPASGLSLDTLAVFTMNTTMSYTQTLVTSELQSDSNPLCQGTRYYYTQKRDHPSKQFSFIYSNTSAPSLGIATLDGCLPDEMDNPLFTYQDGNHIRLNNKGFYSWSADDVDPGTVSLFVELTSPTYGIKAACASAVKVAFDSPRGLSPGAVAGVVIAVVIAFGLTATLAILYWKKLGPFAPSKTYEPLQ